MFYKLPTLPEEFEVVGFEIRRGCGWRIAYWAWRLFRLQPQTKYCGFVARMKP
jgi:hypothetical protein